MEYEKTHRWITFNLNVKTDAYRLWMQLGEVSSKLEHLSGVPLKPLVAEKLNQVFLAKGVLATTAIEGNTLTEEQVLKQVEGDLKLPPSQDYLKQEIKNIIDVINEEVDAQIHGREGKLILCENLIKGYNEQILAGLDLEEGAVPGEIRSKSVVVGNVYRGAPAADCEHLLSRLCEWLNGPDFVAPDEDMKKSYAILKAIVAHVYLAWIHPFWDGNGRTARLVEFHILFSCGLPLPAAHLLSDHYNRTRTMYYRELDKASKSGGDLMSFISYAVRGLLDGLREQIGSVRVHQMEVAWENYVHERFRNKKSTPAQKRRRDLVLELSAHDWVATSGVEDLSVRTAKFYAAAGDRMLMRDLNALAKMGLIFRRHGKVRAAREIIEAFLSTRVKGD